MAATSDDSAQGWLLGGRYRVAERLGSGGMADVFRARDEVLSRDVAIKVFRSTNADHDDASGLDRQLAELHALASLNHPNLTTLYDGSIGGTPAFLVLELVDGPPLSEQIARGPMPEPEVRQLGAQIASALAYVHARGMVHRDVKPANILLGRDRTAPLGPPRARLSDFGVVRMVGSDRMTSANLTVGSASYLSPEQARGQDVGPPSDVYSLGLVLMEAFTGTRPFQGSALEVMSARVHRGPTIPSPLPAPWTQLLTDMTAMDPSDRPAASDVVGVLRSMPRAAVEPAAIADPSTRTVVLAGVAAGAGAIGARSEGDTGSWEPHRNRRGLVAAALAAICIGGVALLLQNTGFSGNNTPIKNAPAIAGQPTTSTVSSPSQSTSGAAVVAARITPSGHGRSSISRTAPAVAPRPPGHTAGGPGPTVGAPAPVTTAPVTAPATTPASAPPSGPASSPAGTDAPTGPPTVSPTGP